MHNVLKSPPPRMAAHTTEGCVPGYAHFQACCGREAQAERSDGPKVTPTPAPPL